MENKKTKKIIIKVMQQMSKNRIQYKIVYLIVEKLKVIVFKVGSCEFLLVFLLKFFLSLFFY